MKSTRWSVFCTIKFSNNLCNKNVFACHGKKCPIYQQQKNIILLSACLSVCLSLYFSTSAFGSTFASVIVKFIVSVSVVVYHEKKSKINQQKICNVCRSVCPFISQRLCLGPPLPLSTSLFPSSAKEKEQNQPTGKYNVCLSVCPFISQRLRLGALVPLWLSTLSFPSPSLSVSLSHDMGKYTSNLLDSYSPSNIF